MGTKIKVREMECSEELVNFRFKHSENDDDLTSIEDFIQGLMTLAWCTPLLATNP